MPTDHPDIRWLDAAARLASPHLGTSGAGPTVGALIVDEARRLVFGRGVTSAGGAVAAETLALGEARELAKGRTLYVTIEPSAGPTPVMDAIAKAGPARVVVGMLDPHKRLAGVGIKLFNQAGIVATHLEHAPSVALNEGYTMRVRNRRPFVTLALTMSADGMLGHRQPGGPALLADTAMHWIERERAASDAILTGVSRAARMGGDLTVRLDGLHTHPHLRVLLIGAGPVPDDLELFATLSGYPTLAISAPERAIALGDRVEHVTVEGRRGRPGLRAVMALLAECGINRLMVEAGAQLADAFIAAELVDRLIVVDSSQDIGRGGVPAAVMGRFEDRIAAARFSEVDRRALGEDKVRTFQRH